MTARPVLPDAVQGALWMLCSGTCYVAASTLMRHLGGAYSTYELTFLRSLIAVAMLTPMLMRAGRISLWPEQSLLHFLTGVFSYLGILFWFLAASQMPVGDFFALQFVTPLITIAMAIVFLRERADAASWAATLIGLAGVLIVLRPGLVAVTAGALAALASSLAYASVNTLVKSLSRTVSATGIVFYANLWLVPISMPMGLVAWRTPLLADLPAIFGVAVLSTLGYMTVTKAIGLAPARVVQPVNFIRMPIAAAFGLVVFGEFPDVWTWVGAFVIFLATSWAVRRGARQ